MFNKTLLVSRIVNSLAKREYDVFSTHGCFDVAARRENLMLVKALTNVDGLEESQAHSLRAISYFLSAFPFVVSVKNNRENLSDKMVYNRFEIPVVSPSMFEHILDEEVFVVEAAKGKHTVAINAFALREKRNSLGLTLKQLAEKIGITKKALYEIENNRVKPMEETVEKIEDELCMTFRSTYEMRSAKPTYVVPKNDFQHSVSLEFARIGVDNSPVRSAPFEIVGKKEFSLITNLCANEKEIRKSVDVVKKLSGVFCAKAVFVAKKSREHEVEGVPVVLESDLPEIESSKELEKLIEEKA